MKSIDITIWLPQFRAMLFDVLAGQVLSDADWVESKVSNTIYYRILIPLRNKAEE